MFNKPKGTRDYFGQESNDFSTVRKILYAIAKKYNYNEVIIPTFESEDLFKKSVGNDTDIVTKEMFKFSDNSDRKMVLRPEGTASTVRMAIENKLFSQNQKPKFFYFLPMFRYERPQKGRQREFFQFGVENFGKDNIENDIETLLFGVDILKTLNIKKYVLKINSIGSVDTRKKYVEELSKYLKKNSTKLSDESKLKLKNNVLRILDSKFDEDINVLKKAPIIYDFLTKEEKTNIDSIKTKLKKIGIKFEFDNSLVRGLDYYNDLVFEFVSTDEENLGAKSTLIGGGRYDSLVSTISNSEQNVNAIGFALGVERLILASKDFISSQPNEKIDYYIVSIDPKYNDDLIKVAHKYRETYVVETNFDNTNLSKKIERALKLNAENLIIIDENIKDKKITIKNFLTQKQKKVKI